MYTDEKIEQRKKEFFLADATDTVIDSFKTKEDAEYFLKEHCPTEEKPGSFGDYFTILTGEELQDKCIELFWYCTMGGGGNYTPRILSPEEWLREKD